tara:strand:- start:1634 stop:2530 length:897 start_codon:yes stop_codon:yes gene_type:complete
MTYSLFIPWFEKQLTQADVEYIFKELKWGNVSNINMVLKDIPSVHYVGFVEISSINKKYQGIFDKLDYGDFEMVYFDNHKVFKCVSFFKVYKNKNKKKSREMFGCNQLPERKSTPKFKTTFEFVNSRRESVEHTVNTEPEAEPEAEPESKLIPRTFNKLPWWSPNRGRVQVWPHLHWGNTIYDYNTMVKKMEVVCKEINETTDYKFRVIPKNTYCSEVNGSWNVAICVVIDGYTHLYMYRCDTGFESMYGCPFYNVQYLYDLNHCMLNKKTQPECFKVLEDTLIKVLGPAKKIDHFES